MEDGWAGKMSRSVRETTRRYLGAARVDRLRQFEVAHVPQLHPRNEPHPRETMVSHAHARAASHTEHLARAWARVWARA